MAGGQGGANATTGAAGGAGYIGQNGAAGTYAGGTTGGGGGGGTGYSPLFGSRSGGAGASINGGTGGAGGAGGGTTSNPGPNGANGGSATLPSGGGSGLGGGGGGGGGGLPGTKFGGVGGNGGNGGAGYSGGGGGAGGYGSTSSAAQVTLSGAYRGGHGGKGETQYALFGGQGGSGGAGFYASASVAELTLQNGANAAGGYGGSGSNAYGPGGGAGGAGVLLAGTNAKVVNSGTATGGAGGYADGSHKYVKAAGDNIGGAPGAGVSFMSSGGSLANTSSGVLQGGAGASYASSGAGVSGAGLTVANSGSIAGGAAADNVAQGDAITFVSGANTLALGGADAASVDNGFTGAIDIEAGTLSFDQAAGAALDSSDTFAANVSFSDAIIGAGAVLAENGGTLTLSGANTYSGGTTVSNSTVSIASDSELGAASGGLTLSDNGTLETTASLNSQRGVALSGGNGVVQVDAGTTTLSGVISGSGAFAKTGAGVLVLSGDNTYSGSAKLNDGDLSVSADDNLGAASDGLTLNSGTLETTATFSSARAVSLTANSAIQVDAGTLTLSGAISGSDLLFKTGAGVLTLSDGSNAQRGTTIDAGTLYDAPTTSGGDALSGAVTFAGTSATPATLELGANAQPAPGGAFGNTLTNFDDNDRLDLKGLAYTGGGSATTLTVSNNTLTVTEGATTERFTLGGSEQTTYYAQSDSAGGTLITDTPVCYCAGAHIRTIDGDVAVERLSIGDLVVTASGEARPIRWLGRRTLYPARHATPRSVWPVRVRAHAFAEDQPRRDLWLSPGHNVAVDGVLTPIIGLINGRSIVQVERDQVEYWHVELDTHDLLLAEGLPAESYHDCDNRRFFSNGGDIVDAHPDDLEPKSRAPTCLPLVAEGPKVVGAKARLLARLAEQGHCINYDADPHILVDGVRVEPICLSETRLCFVLPADGRVITLGSKVFLPSHVMPESDDLRALGLCIGRLQLDGEAVAFYDDCLYGRGWHGAEGRDGPFPSRWTTGATPLPPGVRLAIIDLAAKGRYWSETHRTPATQARA